MLTQLRLKELFLYHPETGVFVWRVSPCPRVKIGDVAGGIGHTGYRQIQVNRRFYLAHRLAWLYTTALWPKDQIDHINGDRADNRILNLREATSQENNRNMKARGSISGFKGVYRARRKWRARIRINRKIKNLGYFDTREEAARAYESKAKELFGAFYCPQTISAEFAVLPASGE
jgi:hypothetical protein